MSALEVKNIELAIVDNIRKFSVAAYQQVLDFVEFLKTKLEPTEYFLALAGKYIACVEAPEDLSTKNIKYG